MKKTYRLQNLDCANCAAKMEKAIRKISGVREATVSFMAQRLMIDTEDEPLETVMKEVRKICKRIEPDCVILM